MEFRHLSKRSTLTESSYVNPGTTASPNSKARFVMAKLTTRRREDNSLQIELAGKWRVGERIPSAEAVIGRVPDHVPVKRITFSVGDLQEWDSSLLAFLSRLDRYCRANSITVDYTALPGGILRLMALSKAVPKREDVRKTPRRLSFFLCVGDMGIRFARAGKDTLDLLGDLALAAGGVLRGKSRVRRDDLLRIIQECGADALPIIALVSFLVGLIMAFVGSIQLALFGAQIYVADLVGIVIAREMGAIMTSIVMAGRTGAAFAAQIATMQTNEEIDALRTLGISPVEFLVLPRVLALVIMMPLLVLYADIIGILGGVIVGVGVLDISLAQYLEQTRKALTVTHFSIGLAKAIVFGFIVAITGCMQGMRSGRSASDVGLATTSAVVIAIVGIIVADGLFAIVLNILDI